MSKETGFVLIHRQIFNNPEYLSETACKTAAWIDLLLLANHKTKTFYIRGNPIIVPRGSVGYSIKTLAQRWRWSQGRANRWFSHLKTVGQIEIRKTHVTTLITIVNYNKFQTKRRTDDNADGEQTENRRRQTKNDNNDKESARTFFYKNGGAQPSSAPPLKMVNPDE